ncbi:MAG TPA: hypothetical protein VFF17_15745 [Thermoanaerobaculia bacterium]|nr:hypothetical protein [Thermoanaerobaculia bacterium]
MNDRRGLVVGVVLLLLGAFFVLSRTFRFSGPGPILVLIGAIFLALSALRRARGPLLPGGVLLGLGTGFLLREPLEGIFPHWATLLLGLGAGFLLVAVLDRATGRDRRPSPLLPGVVLVLVALVGALTRQEAFAEAFARLRDLWPWALVLAGVALVAQAMFRKRGA